jgi:hypothetical protein
MAVVDDSELWIWQKAADPPAHEFDRVRGWVENLKHRPVQPPSIPLPDLWFPGEDEIRVAVLDAMTSRVEVFYWHDLTNDDVELVFVRYAS